MLVVKKTFLGTLVFLRYISLSLLGAHILKKFCIGWDLLDGIKEWRIYLHLVEDLNYLIHVWILLVSLRLIRKWYYRLVHLTG